MRLPKPPNVPREVRPTQIPRRAPRVVPEGLYSRLQHLKALQERIPKLDQKNRRALFSDIQYTKAVFSQVLSQPLSMDQRKLLRAKLVQLRRLERLLNETPHDCAS